MVQPAARAGRVALLALPSVIVLAATGITTGVAIAVQEQAIRSSVVEQVHTVASSLAALPEVRDAVTRATTAGTPSALADDDDLAAATAALQPLASLVEGASGVSYVVVTDDEGVRITHPVASERGELVETTTDAVLAGEEFVGTETGPSGPALRAKVPVLAEDGSVVGIVAVGVLEADIEADRGRALGGLLPWSLAAVLLATLASAALSVAIARRLRRADAVDAEHRQMRRTTDALREQAHEFGTRLHVVRGLAAQGDSAGAVAYIDAVAPSVGDGVVGATAGVAVDDAAFASATIEAVRRELDTRGTRLEMAVDADARVDDDVLLVVANLCRNAAEAGASSVRCIVAMRSGRVVVAVDDDGPGIDPRDAQRVLRRGWSSKPDPTGLGRGVGLDVVRRIAADRGGSVVIGRSSLGGARLDVDLDAVR